MAEVTVSQFAETLKTPVDRLLSQLHEAGVRVDSESATINDEDKQLLLNHLQRKHGDSNPLSAPKKITVNRKERQTLRVAGSGQGGRARTVQVETKKRRTYVNKGVLKAAEDEKLEKERQAEEARRQEEEQAEAEARRQAEAAEAQRQAEEQARRQAEAAAEAEARKQQEEAALRREQEEKRELEKEQRLEQERRDQEERRQREESRPRPAAAEAPRPAPTPRAAGAGTGQSAGAGRGRGKDAGGRGGQRGGKREELHVASGKGGKRRGRDKGRRRGAVTVTTSHGFEKPTAPVVREVEIPETIAVGELAQRMAVKAPEVIKQLMGMGVMATINQSLDQDTATLVVEEMGHTAKPLKEEALEETILEQVQAQGGETESRPPVITIMGHVDHGKTSLLDYIRRTRVTAGEAGGITQHIGAYHVETPRGVITFLDTPGHAAFTAMRARGAQVTDIVVLVVAADDGVMPQTAEAIQHARAAGVPLLVAVNKTDKPDADPDRVRQELTKHEVIPEEWGGETIFVNVSAKTGAGIDDLLESLTLQAEVMELSAVAEGSASGVVLESSLEKGRGAVATLLVSRGTLRAGDALLAGEEYGRVRAMFDERGEPLKQAGPSYPVVVLGLSGTPNAGDDFVTLEDDRKARELAELRRAKARDAKLARQQASAREALIASIGADGDEAQTLNILVKADVQGSSEALHDALTKLSTEKVHVKVVSHGVGGINEGDVNLAVTSQAIMIGFNVRADSAARAAVKEHGIELQYHSVIYEAIDEIKRAMSGVLEPDIVEEQIGLAEVRQVFRSPKFGDIAGCMIIEGVVKRNLPIRVLRDNVVIYEGELESLRRFKDDVPEVRAGTECGIGVRNYNNVREGDQIECYERREVAATI
ncbi:MAG: translation initiation factor IF-2 [Pseudomonadota bacterium]